MRKYLGSPIKLNLIISSNVIFIRKILFFGWISIESEIRGYMGFITVTGC